VPHIAGQAMLKAAPTARSLHPSFPTTSHSSGSFSPQHVGVVVEVVCVDVVEDSVVVVLVCVVTVPVVVVMVVVVVAVVVVVPVTVVVVVPVMLVVVVMVLVEVHVPQSATQSLATCGPKSGLMQSPVVKMPQSRESGTSLHVRGGGHAPYRSFISISEVVPPVTHLSRPRCQPHSSRQSTLHKMLEQLSVVVVPVIVVSVAVLVVDVDVVEVAVVSVAVVVVEVVVVVVVVAVTVVAVVAVVVGMQMPQSTGHLATTLPQPQPAIPTAAHVSGSGLPLHTGVVVVEVAVAVVAVVVVEVDVVTVLVVDDAVIVDVVVQLPHIAGQMCGKSKRSKDGLLQNEAKPGFPQGNGSSTPLHTPLPDTPPAETNTTVAANTAAHDGRRLPCAIILFLLQVLPSKHRRSAHLSNEVAP